MAAVALASPASAAGSKRAAQLDAQILAWVQSRFPNNAGYPATWAESVNCRLPHQIRTGSKIPCTVFFDEPGHSPLLNEGSVTVRVRAHGKDQVSASVSTYRASDYTTTTTTSPQAAYEASCDSVPYAELVKNLSSDRGKCVTFTGSVFQYDSITGSSVMLVQVATGAVSGLGLVAVVLPSASSGAAIVEGDMVQFWGPAAGVKTYATATKGTNTVPVVNAKYLVKTG